ncbi:hypothetical protein ACWGKQ_31810 [Streptomyces sp. NPDC054770]
MVDEQQAFPAVEPVEEYLGFVAVAPGAGLWRRAGVQPGPGEQGGAHLGRFGDRGEVGHPGSVAVGLAPVAGGLDGERGLAGPTGTGNGDQAACGEECVDPGEVVVASGEAGQRCGQVAGRGP